MTWYVLAAIAGPFVPAFLLWTVLRIRDLRARRLYAARLRDRRVN